MAAVDECRRARHFRWKSPQRRPRAERRLSRARRQTIDARRRGARPTIVSRIVDARSRGDTRARTIGRARPKRRSVVMSRRRATRASADDDADDALARDLFRSIRDAVRARERRARARRGREAARRMLI